MIAGNAPLASRIKANSAMIGGVVSSETRKKIRDALKGRPQIDKRYINSIKMGLLL